MNLVKRLLSNPYLWGAIALATLLLGLTPWVYPGEAATQMAQWLGVWETGAGNAHPMAQGVFLGIAWIAPSVAAFNVANALFAALCVLCLCALVRWLIVLLTPEPRTAAHRLTAIAVGVPLAAFALLLSPDFLRAGTHFQWQPLDLALTLATAVHICGTAYNGHHRRMFVAAFAIGVIALCSPWQLLLAPLLTVALGLGYFAAHDRVRIRPFVTCLLIPLLLGMAVVSGVAVCFALGAGASSATGAFKAFVLTQAIGTLGRQLQEGAQKVKIFGEEIAVRAEICSLHGTSGHADKNGLLAWLQGFDKKPEMIFVNHGDDDSCTDFCKTLTEVYDYRAEAPYSGTQYDLSTGECTIRTIGRRIVPKGTLKARNTYNALVNAAQALLDLAKSFKGRTNKEIEQFTAHIKALTEKWKDR